MIIELLSYLAHRFLPLLDIKLKSLLQTMSLCMLVLGLMGCEHAGSPVSGSSSKLSSHELSLVAPPGEDEPAEVSPIEITPLKAVPGMPKRVVQAEGRLFDLLSGTVTRDRETGILRAMLRIPASVNLANRPRDIVFDGDIRRFENMVAELNYLRSQQDAYWIDEVGLGVYNGVDQLIAALWEIVRHPIQTGKAIWNSAGQAYGYAMRLWNGEPLPTQHDVRRFAMSFYENRLAEMAQRNGFDLGMSAMPEVTRQALSRQTNAVLAGEGIFEAATMLFAWLKLTKVKKLKSLTINGRMFPQLQRLRRLRMESKQLKTKKLRVFDKVESKIADRIDPATLKGLKGDRPENRQLYRVMYQLYHGEQYGGSPGVLIQNALKKANASKPIPELGHSPKLVQSQLTAAYEDLKKWGVFDNPEDIQRLMKGGAPVIRRGRFAGQKVHADHIVPHSVEPKLRRNLGNLRVQPASENIKRSNDFDIDAQQHLRKFQNEFPDAVWSIGA